MRIVSDLLTAKAVLRRSPFAPIEVPTEMEQRIKRVFGEELTPEQVVARIIAEVRDRGDAALSDFSRRIDGVGLKSPQVSRKEIEEARKKVDKKLLSALELAAERVRSFHLAQKRRSIKGFMEGGLGQVLQPLERVGIYVPGGTACYPSTVLMTAIPARVAGVKEIILVTPPKSGGAIPEPTLAAADIAQVDLVFRVGGAQAIAALAIGTESIPKVDKICGPGNIFVTLAKKMVFGAVDIDGLAGPTETVILADDSANPAICAADLLAQAEHDVFASAILITTSHELAAEVDKEVERQLKGLKRANIAAKSLAKRGCIIVARNMNQAIELINLYAPEHLALMVRNPASYVNRFRSAGTIFVGESSAETLGDYVAGPSHVLPTAGTARFSSPLGVSDFLKLTTVVNLNEEDLAALGPAAAAIAKAEGLTGHAQAVEARLKKGGKR